MNIYDKVKINPTDSMPLSTVCMVPDGHLRQSQDTADELPEEERHVTSGPRADVSGAR